MPSDYIHIMHFSSEISLLSFELSFRLSKFLTHMTQFLFGEWFNFACVLLRRLTNHQNQNQKNHSEAFSAEGGEGITFDDESFFLRNNVLLG